MLKKQIEEKISKTEIYHINKQTANFILQKLNEFLDKNDSVFIIMDVIKATSYSYHTVRKYIDSIIKLKPILISKMDRYRYILNVRNALDLNIDDVVLPKMKTFGKIKRTSKISLHNIYDKYKNQKFNLKDIQKDFDVSYNLAYRAMKKIINTEGLENILTIDLDGIITFKFNDKEMKKIGY